MGKNPPDERLVYLALKNIFKGGNANLRRLKRIRELVLSHQNNGDVRSLIEEHNVDNVAQTAKLLLEDGIFASTMQARIRFPEVFQVSPAQSAERSASEVEAAKSEADAIKHAAEGHPAKWTMASNDAREEVKGKHEASVLFTIY